jgi:pimeloyl-ACP methyl ester carboxylesterase
VERRDRRSHRTFTSNVPVLFLSGRYDPVTPPAFAERVKRQFPNSRHFVKGDGGHGASGACVAEILADFYEHLDPARLEDRCAAIRSATFEVP